MTKIIAYANQKGGVGKSATCLQSAFYLAEKKFKVLVLDFDGQGNTSSRTAPNVQDEFGSVVATYSGTTTAELFNKDLKNIEVMKCPSGVDLIHTPKNDAALFEMEAIPLSEAVNPKNNLTPLFANYDYVLIDCPPSLGRKLVAALMMATHVVCPVKLSGFAVDGVEGLLTTIIGVRNEFNPSLDITGVLINDMDNSKPHKKALAALEAAIPDLVLKNKIKHRSPFDEATTNGVPIWTLRYGHVAAKEVMNALDEIFERVNNE